MSSDFNRDDVREAYEAQEAKLRPAKPAVARPSKPAPAPKEDPRVAEYASRDQNAEHVAHALHEHGIPPDHPLAQQLAQRAGTTVELVRRHYARIAAGPRPGAMRQAQPKKSKPPDPSALGSG